MGPENERRPGTTWGRAEQFPHLGNYTLTPDNAYPNQFSFA